KRQQQMAGFTIYEAKVTEDGRMKLQINKKIIYIWLGAVVVLGSVMAIVVTQVFNKK
ncbi:hypothetical protein BGW42_006457, partial [Actinomortierella wolfii]